jgi:uptake hydrogenase large subunit
MAQTITMPMNRVEGDLEVQVTIEDGIVTDARVIGTMFRGMESMLTGRGALDGLVITPRICGICSISHLLAAAMALEDLAGSAVSVNGRLVRSIALGAEKLQSDLRHLFLMFTADLTSKRYEGQSLFPEAERRYRPFQGSAVVATILATRKLPEIIAILGGQWPHTSFIVPGGISSKPTEADLRQCRMLLFEFRRWYEQNVLGCSIEEVVGIETYGQLSDWLDKDEAHSNSELGFFLRCGRAFGLDAIGASHGSYLAVPDRIWYQKMDVAGGGFLHDGVVVPFNQQEIVEQVTHAKYHERSSSGHPLVAETHPVEQPGSGKYSWCKAPRYGCQPAETGPLAETLIRRDPLFSELVAKAGASVLARELARLLRPGRIVQDMEKWLRKIDTKQIFYHPATLPDDGTGIGLIQAPRGMLGHWVQLSGGYIDHYQVITPTTWNASPRDDRDVPGPIEQALLGTPVADSEEPVEVGHVVRSFDPCMVCSVHAISKNGASLGRLRIGT